MQIKIALIGYGKMGQIIERIALDQGHHIVARVHSGSWDLEAVKEADVCVEFTRPDAVVENISRLAPLGKPIVVGTTGWHDRLEEVLALVEEHQIGLLYSSNFSIGVNLLFSIVAHAACEIQSFEYDISGVEMHHRNKKDQPSGTAKELSRIVKEKIDREIPFSSIRCGSHPGAHTILFDSACDTITISHEARNREGFAKGALLAANWLIGRKGVYNFFDLLNDKNNICV